MKKHSAGLIVYRRKNDRIELLVGHMGGPWWAKKDAGAWSIPKGEIDEGEKPFDTAKREFREELGIPAPNGEYLELGSIEQHNKKIVTAWAVEADLDVKHIKGNTFESEWPPRSGIMQEFPEIDRAEWMSLETAAQKTVRGQEELFKRLAEKLDVELDNLSSTEEEKPKQNSLF